MYTKNNGSGENNVIQNRFTAYLLTAIHRKKATYLGACSKRREMELPTDPDDIVSVLDAMVNSAGDAPLRSRCLKTMPWRKPSRSSVSETATFSSHTHSTSVTLVIWHRNWD